VSLKESASKIKKAHEHSCVKRIMWSALDERIETVFSEINKNKEDAAILGNLYLSKAKDYEPIRSARIYLCSYQYVNATYIHTGYRHLGVNIVDKDSKQLVSVTESNAQIWYSQSPVGDVLVFIAPYTSNAGKITENEIIIGKYKEPALINISDIHNHFNTFFKYCACTSQPCANSIKNYAYRKYLLFNDFRYRPDYRNKLFKYLERIFLFIFGAASILVTLYVSDKL